MVWWDLSIDGGPIRRVILAQTGQGIPGAWPRIIALAGPGLETVAILWGPVVIFSPAGASVSGMVDLEGTGCIQAWSLTNPRSERGDHSVINDPDDAQGRKPTL